MAKSDLFFMARLKAGPQLLSQQLIFPTANLVPVCPRTLSAPATALQNKQIETPRGYLQPLTKLPISLAGPVDNVLLHQLSIVLSEIDTGPRLGKYYAKPVNRQTKHCLPLI